MDGIINILKPPGMTSFDVVGYLRGILKTKKIGHAGTLDPDAAGVLPVCTGKATKAIEYIMDKDKLYRAEMTLGISTDTQDSSGEIIETREVKVDKQQVVDTIHSFEGKYMQVPPMYSAIRIGGKKLYELARKGMNVEREAREVTVYHIKVLDISGLYEGVSNRRQQAGPPKVMFDVACSKGTYIRTLCSDIGEKLGCGAHMSFLLRLRAGTFDISTAITLEDIEECFRNGTLHEKIIPVETVFKDYPRIELDGSNLKKYVNGVPVILERLNTEKGEAAVFDMRNCFLGIGVVRHESRGMVLRSKKLFI